jgi:glutathione peroxidase
MKPTLLALLLAGLSLTACSKDQAPKNEGAGHGKGHDCPLCKAADEEAAAKAAAAEAAAPLDRTVTAIDGKLVNLTDHKGKVVLIVNVASKCGYTKQYAGLQSLYTSRKDKGLTVLGFPSNDFKNQEPAAEVDIKKFCSDTYQVTFPMFAKVSVKGDQACDLYKALAAAPAPAAEKDAAPATFGEPKWNFTKYLLNRKGEVIAKFDSAVTPDDPKLTAAIDAALAQK